MSGSRFKIVLVLLVLTLLLASLVFGLLTYWLGQEVLPATTGQALQVVALAVLVRWGR